MFKITKEISTPYQIKQSLPMSSCLAEKKHRFDQLLKDNFISKEKLVLVVGPCSADDPIAVHEYCQRLKSLADRVADKIIVVARVYTSKPHSDGDGFLGLAFHDADGNVVDLEKGLIKCRNMMLDCLEIGLPIADELLFCNHYDYFDDIVSYWFLGARSSLDTMHRSFASGIDTLVGVKNATDGNLLQTAQSLYAVSRPKTFLKDGCQIETSGNSYVHAVLRGYSTEDKMVANLDAQSIRAVVDYCNKFELNPFVMVDVSHANSNKVAKNQIINALEVASNKDISGIMIESYLNAGKGCGFGVSKTDDCLSFEQTEDLIWQLYKLR